MGVVHPGYGSGVVKALNEHAAEILFSDGLKPVDPEASGLAPAEPQAGLTGLNLPLSQLIAETVGALADRLGLEKPDARVRELAPTVPLLIPGVGAQGGDAVATVKAGWRANADGSSAGSVIVNSSRAVLYASSGDDFAAAARQVAKQTRDTLEAAKA